MGRFCGYLRNVQDLLSDVKIPYERRFGKPFKGPIIPFGSLVEYYFFWGRPVQNPSIWKESVTWTVSRIRSVRGVNLQRWRTGCRPWGVGNHGRIRGDISQRKRKFLFFQPQMDESHSLEEIRNLEHPLWHANVLFEEKVTFIFLENQKSLFHHLTTRFRMPVKRLMTSGPCQETSYTAITLNPESNFIRREKNHSLFHWNTLTSPEPHERIWMLNKNAALTTIGTSMGQKICLLLGQVSLSFF